MKDSFSGNNKGRKEALGELTALQFISLLDLVRFLVTTSKKFTMDRTYMYVDLLGHQIRTIDSEKYQEFIAMYAYKTSIFLIKRLKLSSQKESELSYCQTC